MACCKPLQNTALRLPKVCKISNHKALQMSANSCTLNKKSGIQFGPLACSLPTGTRVASPGCPNFEGGYLQDMNRIKFVALLLAFLALCAVQAKADGTPIVLTFEGIGDEVAIGNYYNGGAGPNYGVQFGPDALSIISEAAGGTGNFSNNPSGNAIAFFLTGPGDVMDVAAGFTSGFSFFFADSSYTGSVTVWSGLDGTGTLLATLDLPSTGGNCHGSIYTFSCWETAGVTFAGTAESAVFSGTANEIGFDDITIGSATAGGGGGTGVPEPGTLALLGVGMAGTAALKRRRRLA